MIESRILDDPIRSARDLIDDAPAFPYDGPIITRTSTSAVGVRKEPLARAIQEMPYDHKSKNLLLDRLPEDEFARIKPDLQSVTLDLKQTIHQFHSEIEYVYFPTTALLSLLTVLEEDDPVEGAIVGKDGLAGLSAALGGDLSPHRVICQIKGNALRMSAHRFKQALQSCPELTRLVQRYTLYSFQATSQAVACNVLHLAEQRTCRWLLLARDLAGGDEFPMTNEFLAYMLGVRRQSVTVIVGTLQGAGLIDFRRGVVSILDVERLREAACECYRTIRNYYDRIVR